MFKKLFSKTTKKAEQSIEKAEITIEHFNEVAKDMKQALSGVKILVALSTVGVLLGITADIVSIVVSGRTVRIIKR